MPMIGPGRDFSWLPEHQEHVASTLAHADDLIARASDIYFAYMSQEPLDFENVFLDDVCHTTVRAVAPLPAGIARYAADALTQLRAAIEHTIYAEVEHGLGRELTREEGRAVEMPALTAEPELGKWLKDRRRQALPPLQDGSALIRRIRDLQPYHRRDSDQHPLRLLVEHTNYAKHRAPAVAATAIGAVIPDFTHPEVELAESRTGGPARAGDVLATAPRGVVVPLDIWPTVAIRRPHTDTWHVLVTELGALEQWVRAVAVPILVTGAGGVDALPPQLDTTVGHADVRAALAAAGQLPAITRLNRRFQAGIGRQSLVDILAMYPGGPGKEVVEPWVDRLTDDHVLERLDEVTRHRQDPVRFAAALRVLLAEAYRTGRPGS
jgi:hypothetical protein